MKDKYFGNENNSQDDSSPVKTREEILGKRKLLKIKSVEDDSTMKPKKKLERVEKVQGESKEEFDERLNSTRHASISSRKETRRLL